VDGTGVSISRTLDCREALCPGPIIDVSRTIRAMAIGEVLEVLATDPGFLPDIRAFSEQTGHQLLATRAEEGTLRVLIRRRR
jgi:tRNA 2-thiouridine synthesizing protein A